MTSSSIFLEYFRSSGREDLSIPTTKGIGAIQKFTREGGRTGMNTCCQLNGYKVLMEEKGNRNDERPHRVGRV